MLTGKKGVNIETGVLSMTVNLKRLTTEGHWIDVPITINWMCQHANWHTMEKERKCSDRPNEVRFLKKGKDRLMTFWTFFEDFREADLGKKQKQKADRKTKIDMTKTTEVWLFVWETIYVCVHVRVGLRSKVGWSFGDVAGGRHGGGRDRGGRGSRAVI